MGLKRWIAVIAIAVLRRLAKTATFTTRVLRAEFVTAVATG